MIAHPYCAIKLLFTQLLDWRKKTQFINTDGSVTNLNSELKNYHNIMSRLELQYYITKGQPPVPIPLSCCSPTVFCERWGGGGPKNKKKGRIFAIIGHLPQVEVDILLFLHFGNRLTSSRPAASRTLSRRYRFIILADWSTHRQRCNGHRFK